MEKTSSLSEGTPQSDTAFDPLAVLDGMVSTLGSLESAIASLQALREYTLAIASRLAEVMNNDAGAVLDGTARPGFTAAAWVSRSAELAQRTVAAEIATATRANDRTIQRQMGQAVELLDRFPVTFGALAAGRISLAHARVIQDAGTVLDDPDALSRYEFVVVACAEQHAPGRVRRLAVREAERGQPELLATRHERACEERRVWVTPLPDGMAELAATLPAAVAYGIHDRLTQMAKAHAEASASQASSGPAAPESTAGPAHRIDQHTDQRTTDQLRADLLSELLLRGAPTAHDTPDGLLAAITAHVDVTVPVLTLIDGGSASATGNAAMSNPAADRPEQVPAELDGRHPIDPLTARVLAGQATAWNRVLTDPFTGVVLAVDRYRPGEDLKRLLAARDTRCRFPGCGIKASDLDLDHTHDAALGGATEAGNLAGLCRRHHMLKHHSRWKVRQTGAGVLEWISPTGRRNTDHPPIPATTTVGTGNKPPPF